MSNYEFFSDESSLNAAYNSAALDTVSSDIPYCDEEVTINNVNIGNNTVTESVNQVQEQPKQSTLTNLWQFLGLNNIGNEKKECLFDCSIQGARCLETCEYKDKEKCKYRCLKLGLNCSKHCLVEPEPEPTECIQRTNQVGTNQVGTNQVGTSQVGVTTASLNNHSHNHSNNHSHSNNHVNSNNNLNNNRPMPPLGNASYFNSYAPYDSNLWPGHNKYGWDLNKIAEHSSEGYIEVLVEDRFPLENQNNQNGL